MIIKILKLISTFFDRLLHTPFWRIKWTNTYSVDSRINCDVQSVVAINDSYLKSSTIIVKGNNELTINSMLVDSFISISGHNNTVEIVNVKDLNRLKLQVIGNNCRVVIDEGTTMNGAHLVCMGNGNELIIGKGCMFAAEIEVWASDSHPIYTVEKANTPINPSKSIHFADHVWVAQRACILKGVSIGENAIVGMASVVTKDVPASCIVAGNPAKVIKTGIIWNNAHITI